MNALEAQGRAACLVRGLRERVRKIEPQLQAIGRLNREVTELLPLLTPSAAAEVTEQLKTLGTLVGAAFTDTLNPADEPA